MKKRFIFDLDHTLINTEYDNEFVYFQNVYGENSFAYNIKDYLHEYEGSRLKYQEDDFCKYFSDKIGYPFDKEILQGWQDYSFNYEEKVIDGAKELLEELKFNDKEIVVLTNWFTKCQKERLNRCGLLNYIDNVYGGDIYLKPNKEAFITAVGNNKIEDCLMIGDTYSRDITGANSIGLEALLFNDKEEIDYKPKIKTLKEVRKWI